jgi:hypothetical protein
MGKKSEESRDVYNQTAFEYDASREVRYTAFHVKELMNSVELKESDVVLDIKTPRLMQFNYSSAGFTA